MRRPTGGPSPAPRRLAGLAFSCLLAGAAAVRTADAAEGTPPGADKTAPPATPAAGPSTPPACGAQAARYDDGRGFALSVTRAGQVRVENPLRPLTPEVTQVLQVVIGDKAATAYGPDFTALRRGGAPAAVEAMLGGPVRWGATLPALPDPIAIVGEDGAALATLAFRACEDPPAVKAPAQARSPKQPGKPRGAPDGRAAVKVPPGFSLPQGVIPE